MCFDPWELDIHGFGGMYLGAIREAQNPRQPYRGQWAARAEAFADGYADKLRELSNEELSEYVEFLTDIEASELLIEPVERERKRRAEEGTAHLE